MQIRLTSLIVATLCAVGLLMPVAAQSPPAVAEAEGAAEEQSGTEGDSAEEDELEETESVGGQMGEVSLDKFVPSEEISADGAVSFPVDI